MTVAFFLHRFYSESGLALNTCCTGAHFSSLPLRSLTSTYSEISAGLTLATLHLLSISSLPCCSYCKTASRFFLESAHCDLICCRLTDKYATVRLGPTSVCLPGDCLTDLCPDGHVTKKGCPKGVAMVSLQQMTIATMSTGL